MPDSVVADASGTNKAAGGIFLYLRLLYSDVYGVWQFQAEVLLP